MLRKTPARNQARARRARTAPFPAPVAGWINNRNLSQAEDGANPPGAEILDNFFPTATGARLRRGCIRYATLEGDGDVKSLFTYILGGNEKLFGSNDTWIYDITSVSSPYNWAIGESGLYRLGVENEYLIGSSSTRGMNVFPSGGNGDWSVVQYGTTGGTWLIGVNGLSDGFIYDGESFYPNVSGGVYSLTYTDGVSDFLSGETVTGGTSGATATIFRVDDTGIPGVGTLILTGKTGNFSGGEVISSASGLAEAVTQTQIAGGTTFPSGSTLTTADLSFVWSYKDRLFYIEGESLNVWFGPIDGYQGELTLFPMNGIFALGGSLLFGASWSLNTSTAGGMSAQCVFITTEGEVAVFQGTSPSDATTWALVGLYQIGRPLGKNATIRAGGDLVISTSIGMVPLSKAVQVDNAALAPVAISYPIERAWNEAVELRGRTGWRSVLWPDAYMALVVPPRAAIEAVAYVVNARTGAWCRFTGWDIRSMTTFQGRLYFGSTGGGVFLGNVSGRDDGAMYSGLCVPLFKDFGAASSIKAARMLMTDTRSNLRFNERITALFDWRMNIPPAPSPSPVMQGNEWDNGVWDLSVWNAPRTAFTTQTRHSGAGMGYNMSVAYQVSSDSIPPVDIEIVSFDVTYEPGDAFS